MICFKYIGIISGRPALSVGLRDVPFFQTVGGVGACIVVESTVDECDIRAALRQLIAMNIECIEFLGALADHYHIMFLDECIRARSLTGLEPKTLAVWIPLLNIPYAVERCITSLDQIDYAVLFILPEHRRIEFEASLSEAVDL